MTGSISSLREPQHVIYVGGAMLCAFSGCHIVKSARLKSYATYLIPFLKKAAYAKSPFDFRGRDLSGLQSWE